MRKLITFPALLSLFLLVPASITWAQKITQEKGLTTAECNLTQGRIKIYLPDDIRPGDLISGRMMMESEGRNARQSEKNLQELLQYSFLINQQKLPVDKTNFREISKDYDIALKNYETVIKQFYLQNPSVNEPREYLLAVIGWV